MLKRLAGRVDRLLTFKRASVYALLLIALYAVASVQVLLAGNPPLNSAGVPIGGDYIAFHSAARLLLSGRGADIYDQAALAAVQDQLLGGRIANFYDAYRNPPFYVLLYVPFAALDLLPGYVLFTVFSLGCLALALWLLVAEMPALRSRWPGLVILVLAFPPVYFGLIDGENATLALLLYALLYRSLVRGEDRAAGVWAALGLFKPQLFVVFPLVFLARRQWRALAAYIVTAFALAVVSLLLVGPEGMQAWLRILFDQESGNASVNAWRMASLKSFFDSLLPRQMWLAMGLYLMTTLLLLSCLVHVWSSRRLNLHLAWTFTVLTAVLIDPHLVDYDLTVLVAAAVSALLLIPELRPMAVGVFALLPLRAAVALGDSVSIQLSVLVLLGCIGVTLRAIRRKSVSNQEQSAYIR
ncbi:MAG TPA: glycosyltransferase family 87 protein [Chloroflexota bacterium]|jgi:hypothetical protein|nr:glycosyltransferase family 87 protein [Chloroflexota bacterium]